MTTIPEINAAIRQVDTNQVSDGYHTFSELYDHRISLWITLCRQVARQSFGTSYPIDRVWRSRCHSDGALAFGGGWFVLGVNTEAGKQMTYHLPDSYWDDCGFAYTLEKAPDFDGHTAADVLERLKTL